ncbi:branched-chain amino acid aminotransferase [Cytobacillus depressus]|uniref:Branched-chain amino acid aminotransferase n=1 Tax=Cytobacillus depressus TaxID=1602942 RepID=A0A6L3V292_9BACI|nr:branched-chain amino acid aminotransferase [Cytobacillus depressus]KAB2330181.1 branched-chain amino acid aminotransferase [Cytobacillus depressus]
MLSKNLQAFISKKKPNVELLKEEIDFAKKVQIIDDMVIEKNDSSLFSGAYVERSHKETEELIAEEAENFLDQPVSYLKNHISEFLYIESERFSVVGADSICLEIDDVFGTYEAMLGLKLQKKHEKSIKDYLKSTLNEEGKFSLLFSQTDGLWDFNFALNGVKGFTEEMTIGEACKLIYLYLFKLVETVEENK